MKTLEYPLQALTMTEKQCATIMKPVLQGALSKTSLSFNFPRKVLYGTKEEGGLNLNSLYITQGISHIQFFQQFFGTNTISGHLLSTSLETCILEIGIGRNFFTLDYTKYGVLVTGCWIKHLWQFFQEHNIVINDRYTSYPPLQRENDVYLMEIFQEEGYSSTQLKKLNRCRMYTQTITLSDVMTGYGNTFNNTFKTEKQNQSRKIFVWPRYHQPGSSSRKLWRKALRKCFGLQ